MTTITCPPELQHLARRAHGAFQEANSKLQQRAIEGGIRLCCETAKCVLPAAFLAREGELPPPAYTLQQIADHLGWDPTSERDAWRCRTLQQLQDAERILDVGTWAEKQALFTSWESLFLGTFQLLTQTRF